jgi:hypothetical protein
MEAAASGTVEVKTGFKRKPEPLAVLALSCERGDTPSISAPRLPDRPAAHQMRHMSANFRYL